MKLKRLAVAWFDEVDWPAWRAMDANFRPEYLDWLQRTESTFTRLEAAGVPVVKVTFTPDEFLEWSKANGGGVNSIARATFAAFKMLSIDERPVLH